MADRHPGRFPPLWAVSVVLVVGVTGYVLWHTAFRLEPWERQPRSACEQAMYAAAYEPEDPESNRPERVRVLWDCAGYDEWRDAAERYPGAFAGFGPLPSPAPSLFGMQDPSDPFPSARSLCLESEAASPVCRDMRDLGFVSYGRD